MMPDTLKRNAKPLACMLLAAGMMVGSTFAGTMDVVLCRNPETSLLWKTVATENPSVALSWPEGAVKARLTVVGKCGGAYEITDTSATSFAVPLTLPTSEADEDVITMTLAYLDAGGSVVSTETARLGLACGTVNGACIRFAPTTSAASKPKSLVMMVPDGATSLLVNGTPVEPLSAPDWYRFARAGSYALSLALPDETLERNVVCGQLGLSIFIK